MYIYMCIYTHIYTLLGKKYAESIDQKSKMITKLGFLLEQFVVGKYSLQKSKLEKLCQKKQQQMSIQNHQGVVEATG